MANLGILLNPQLFPVYDPLGKPHEIPTEGIFDSPAVKVCINSVWAGHISGMVARLIVEGAWQGDEDAQNAAINQVLKFMDALGNPENLGDCSEMNTCCYDTIARRVTADGEIQISINGGDFIPDPADPRLTAVLMPPITMDEHHTKCDAASNVNEHLNDIITETSGQLGGTGSIIEIASVIVLAVFALFLAPESIPALAPVILPLISAILFLGQAAFDAYFDSTVHDLILCAIYCTIDDVGTFTDAQYAALIAKLTSDLPGSPAKDYFIQIVGRIGLVGINDYAAVGTSADADCSSCDCGEGCDLSNWAVGSGTEVSRTTTTITVDATFDGSNWTAAIYSTAALADPANTSDCCSDFLNSIIVSGTTPSTIFYVHCGTLISVGNFDYAYSNQSANYFGQTATGVFRITFRTHA